MHGVTYLVFRKSYIKYTAYPWWRVEESGKGVEDGGKYNFDLFDFCIISYNFVYCLLMTKLYFHTKKFQNINIRTDWIP